MQAKRMNTSKRSLGYVRVSTTQQADFGVSLEAQTEKIRGWCDTNSYELVNVFVDRGLSGGRFDNRPALQEALRVVSRGDSLVVYSLSRLARSTRDTLSIAESLERKGADLVSLSERLDTTSSSGKLLFRMLAVLGEFERDLVSERTSLAMAHLRSTGRFCGGMEPYGYRSVDGLLQVIPEEMGVIRLIHQFRAEGESLRSISKRLSDRGICSRAGKPLHHALIDRILKDSPQGEQSPSAPSMSLQDPFDTKRGTHE